MKLAALVWSLAALLAWSAAAQDAARIGTIKTLRGDARVIGPSGSVAAAIGSAVRQNDTLETGADGALGLTFIDNTTLSMGAKSRITLTKVVFDPDQNDFAFATSIVKGTFMFVSGSIAKLAPQAVQITTPVNTIGIRGTRFLVRID
ncbi:MAG TPA: FecR domain-containing protein [Stellaceae bacterium]|nr:FecR domain-containing protein [Stellaceae bacterium]